jgi:hypothetical protein
MWHLLWRHIMNIPITVHGVCVVFKSASTKYKKWGKFGGYVWPITII